MSDSSSASIVLTREGDQARLYCEQCGQQETQPLDAPHWKKFSDVGPLEEESAVEARCKNCGNRSGEQPEAFDGNDEY